MRPYAYAYGVILIVDMCIRIDCYIAPKAHVNSAMRHLTTLGYALLYMALSANYQRRLVGVLLVIIRPWQALMAADWLLITEYRCSALGAIALSACEARIAPYGLLPTSAHCICEAYRQRSAYEQLFTIIP